MKKTAIFVAIVFIATFSVFSISFLAPTTVSAAYGYSPCTDLQSNLTAGLTDSLTAGQVSILQNFLISRNYLSAYTPTGYFDNATTQAVTAYQMSHGIFGNGLVDTATRLAINSDSCNGSYNSTYSNAYIGYNNYNNIYSGYQNGYYGGTGYYNNYYSAPVISSFSTNSAPVGTAVTIYGSGFDLFNNTINFNGQTIIGIPSYKGTALAFTVPQIYNSYNSYNYNYNYNYNLSGTYSVSVTTSHGISNVLNFNVTSYNNYNNYNYNYNYNYNLAPVLTSIYPTSGRVGTQVVLSGSSFTPSGNVVHFGNGGMSNVSASNGGNTIYYTIPSYVSGCDITTGYATACPMYAQQITPGSYPIYVSNTYGQTSVVYFSVTY